MDITIIIKAVIALLSAIVSCVLIPWIRSRTDAAQQEELRAWTAVAVAAAEQIYAGQGRGEAKKAYVIQWLEAHGLALDADAIDAMIESTPQSRCRLDHERLRARRSPPSLRHDGGRGALCRMVAGQGEVGVRPFSAEASAD